MATNSNQLIFIKGKERALKTLFTPSDSKDIETFGYLAIGYDPEQLGFKNKEGAQSIKDEGFIEIESDVENSYVRIPLEFDRTYPDYDTSKAFGVFKATLPANVIVGQPINQFAVVNTSEPNDANTVIYSASTFPTFNKTSASSITFVVTFRM